MIDDDSGVVDLGDGTLKTGIPPKSAPEAWLNSVLRAQERIDIAVLNLQGHTDPRIYYMARQLLQRIPKEETRIKLLKALDDEVEKINNLPISSEEKGHRTIIASQNAEGLMVTYADQVVGIEKTLVIRNI